MSRRPRGLTPGERALWEAHARRYRPLASPAPASEGRAPSAVAEASAGARSSHPEPPRNGPPPRIGPSLQDGPPSRSTPLLRSPEVAFVPAPFRIGERARAIGGTAAGAPLPDEAAPALDRKAQRALARGRVAPQARLDLHGMTLDRAHPALAGFVRRAHADGLRLVLVITGKGRPDDGTEVIARPRGVLRRQVPAWLAQPPLAALVQRIAPAHRRHGGEGAFYVHLRRR